MKKETLFRYGLALFAFLLFAAGLELLAYVLLVRQGLNFYLPLELRDPEAHDLRGRYETYHSAEVGWEFPATNPHGYRGPPVDVDTAAAALFGESFSEGHPEIEKSWAYLLAESLHAPVLNFAIGGHGPDQALLRFEKRYVKKLRTRYVLVGVMSENIARILGRYRGFYIRRTSASFTKPRFVLGEDGKLELLPNPIQRPDEATRLGSLEFLREIGAQDYWFHHYERYGLNRHIAFPYSYYLARALPFYTQRFVRFRIGNEEDHTALYDDPSAVALLHAILDRFTARIREEGAEPIVLFFPNWKDMVQYRATRSVVYEDFVAAFRAQHPATLDVLQLFTPLLDAGKPVTEFFRSYTDGHYNEDGERIVAEGVAWFLAQ